MLKLDIVTPERHLLAIECKEITLPGLHGEFGVLEGHISMLAALKTGILSSKGDENLRLMVTNGFVEINSDCVRVLSEAAAIPSEVDEKFERSLIKELREKLQKVEKSDIKEFNRLKVEIERSLVKLQLL